MEQTCGSLMGVVMHVCTLPFLASGDVPVLLGVKQKLQPSVLPSQICKANTMHTTVGFVYFMARIVLAEGFE